MSKPTEKILTEQELYQAMERKVIDRAIQVQVDNGPRGTWPGEVLVKATRQLCKEADTEEITPLRIDRVLEDAIINENLGAFWWDSSNKRHLRLNPEGWNERNKTSPPTPAKCTLGDLTGVYSH